MSPTADDVVPLDPEVSFAKADGVRIRVHDHGGDGPALVLVHATGFHGRVWDPAVPLLRERFRVVALDQRGHGDSDKPRTGYAWEGFGRDVLAVVDHLGLDEPRGMGHSAGAAALILAEAERPGTFDRLVLCDPVLAPPEWRELARAGPNPLAEGARRRRRVWNGPEQMAERLREGTPLSGWREDFLHAYALHGTVPLEDGTVRLKCPPEVEAQVYEMGMRHEGWERLADLTCPVLFLAGESSDLWEPERREQVEPRLRDGRLEVVAGAGHFFPMERPDETFERALPFLDEG